MISTPAPESRPLSPLSRSGWLTALFLRNWTGLFAVFLGIEAMTSAFGGSGTPSLRHYAATPTALVDTTQLVTQTLIYAAIATAVQTHTPQETPKLAPQNGRKVQEGIVLLTLAIGAADFVACYGLLGPLSVHWPVYEAGLVALLMGELILAVPLPSHATAAIRAD